MIGHTLARMNSRATPNNQFDSVVLTETHSRLLQRPADQPLAWLTQTLNNLALRQPCLPISQTQFLNHVTRVAAAIPDKGHAINLCDNRYLFLVSLCAVIVKGGTNLLPPNKKASTQSQLSGRYDNCLLLHDGAGELAAELPQFDVSQLDWSLSNAECDNPMIAHNHIAAISFTSGSTGESKPNIKSWHTLVASSAINASHMLADNRLNYAHIATVPGQHMWGFETSLLLPMFSNASLVDARPFFPHDIINLIERLPTPCRLISAPLHLKTFSATLKKHTLGDADLSSILCATAPLDHRLAHTLEQQTGAELREVYGCSEVGSMAVRQTARDQSWQPFRGLNFAQEGSLTTVDAPHLPLQIQLEDQLEFQTNGRFRLLGRTSDQIKIAGKRGSLGEVNTALHRCEGIIDGTVIFPPQERSVPRLVALAVLDDSISVKQVRQQIARYLDSAFVPRPILVVDELPREENGKLSKAKVMQLYQSLITRS